MLTVTTVDTGATSIRRATSACCVTIRYQGAHPVIKITLINNPSNAMAATTAASSVWPANLAIPVINTFPIASHAFTISHMLTTKP